jgi:hypothetical protein
LFFASTTLFARRALPFFSLAVINTSIPQVIICIQQCCFICLLHL